MRILILCATFPPRGGSGVQRAYHQADLLTAAGHDVWVITEFATELWVHDRSFTPAHINESKITRIPNQLNVINRARRKAGKYVAFAQLYPDLYAPWRSDALREACKIVSKESIDVVLVSVGSPSALEVAARLKQATKKLSLVVDMRDLWVGNPVRFMGRGSWQPLKTLRDRINERRWLTRADAIINVSDNHSHVLQKRYPQIGKEKFHVIQNGFDEAKFATAIPERNGETRLLIRYIGFVLPEQRPEVFFRALKQVDKNAPNAVPNVCCEFYGGNPGFVEREAQKAGVQHLVTAYGYVDHDRAVSLMLGADVLLLLWTNDPGCMCGKFYEYLRSGQFILAFDQNNKDARKVLDSTARGKWLSVDDTDSHARKIQELIDTKISGQPLQPDCLPEITEFSRQHQAEHLAQILKDVLLRNQ